MTATNSTTNSPDKKRRSSPRYWIEIRGKLYARLQYKSSSGKYKVKYKAISDKRSARSTVEAMRHELELHGAETLASDKMTFREFALIYKERQMGPAIFENQVKISGRKSNVDWALNALTEHFGHKHIRTIKPSDLENYKKIRLTGHTWRGTKRTIATVNRELALLRTMLNFALQNDWIIQNPFTKIKGIISLSAEIERDRVLSFEEESRLLEACMGQRAHLKPILICALDTAMRRGEILKMKWQDVNFETGEIHIPQTNTKTEEARTVGMTARLREELEQLWDTSPQTKEATVFGIGDTIKTAWKTACRLSDVQDFRFHDCRHTATTRMIASGSPHTEVMKITGHSQLKTFLRYLNITTQTANKVADRLGDYLVRSQTPINEISDKPN